MDFLKKKMIYIHYHQKCQDITDNIGDIELDLIQSSQNTVFTWNELELGQDNQNQLDLKLIWMFLRER